MLAENLQLMKNNKFLPERDKEVLQLSNDITLFYLFLLNDAYYLSVLINVVVNVVCN